jgi:hypothetical protein
MAFWNKKKRKSFSGNGPSSSKPTGKRKYQPLEVKVMAMEAKEAGLTSREVAEVVGVKRRKRLSGMLNYYYREAA